MEKESRGDETEDGEEILAVQLKAEKSRQSYADFLRKFSVLREELHADPDEFDLNYYTYGLRLYGNMPLIEPVESREVKKIQEFVIVVDTSYSTSGELIHKFFERDLYDPDRTEQVFLQKAEYASFSVTIRCAWMRR